MKHIILGAICALLAIGVFVLALGALTILSAAIYGTSAGIWLSLAIYNIIDGISDIKYGRGG